MVNILLVTNATELNNGLSAFSELLMHLCYKVHMQEVHQDAD